MALASLPIHIYTYICYLIVEEIDLWILLVEKIFYCLRFTMGSVIEMNYKFLLGFKGDFVLY